MPGRCGGAKGGAEVWRLKVLPEVSAWLFAYAEAFTLSRGMICRPTIAMGNFMATEKRNGHPFFIVR
jgi:hypothetical protein